MMECLFCRLALLALLGVALVGVVSSMAVASKPDDEDVVDAVEQECVQFNSSHCPPLNTSYCRCHTFVNATHNAMCCHIRSEYELKEGLACIGAANITAIHLHNVTLDSLNVSFLGWQRLKSLAVTDGHIPELKDHLDAPNLTCLNLSSIGLVGLEKSDALSSLNNLHNLDLSWNNLTHLPSLSVQVPHFWLDISGNNNVSCNSIMELIKNVGNTKHKLHFSHDNFTYCLMSQSFHWFNSTDKVPLSSVVLLNKLEQECPHGKGGACTCSIVALDMVAGKLPTFSVSVDCSGRKLAELPPDLPRNTISLNVSVNNISDLKALSMNSAYKNIRMFYADDNHITSIVALEGSAFIDSFMSLSLRKNNISSLPTYILSNVFDRNFQSRSVHLGLNRFNCDCSTAQTVKMWLIANKKHIPDYHEVLCENMPQRVFELDQNKVCIVQSDWTDYVYYLVAAEVLLLLLLVTKVSYDYWVFKTAGYLPWPASKMPKLPCDWVFE